MRKINIHYTAIINNIINTIFGIIALITCLLLALTCIELTDWLDSIVNQQCRAVEFSKPFTDLYHSVRTEPKEWGNFIIAAFASTFITNALLNATIGSFLEKHAIIIYRIVLIAVLTMWVTGPLLDVITNNWCN